MLERFQIWRCAWSNDGGGCGVGGVGGRCASMICLASGLLDGVDAVIIVVGHDVYFWLLRRVGGHNEITILLWLGEVSDGPSWP